MVTFIILAVVIVLGIGIYYFWFKGDHNISEDRDDFGKNKADYMRSQLK